jgi:organic hydroperoxide reductase OsmC/OhrA
MTSVETSEAKAPAPPKARHKTFTYRTSTDWTSARSGILGAPGRPALPVSSPPEFKGEPGRWTPEDLFVAAIDLCTMTTFVAFAHSLNLRFLSYRSDAEGTLEFADGGYCFTRVVLRPTIVLADPTAVETAMKAMHDAHEACLIGRSVRSVITVEPRFEVAVRSAEG